MLALLTDLMKPDQRGHGSVFSALRRHQLRFKVKRRNNIRFLRSNTGYSFFNKNVLVDFCSSIDSVSESD
jgi:hypothetical protein